MNTVAAHSRLSQVEAFPVSIPLVLPFAITGSSQMDASVVFVCVTDENGLKGWGEASPLPVVTGDDVPSTLAFLEAQGAHLMGATAGEAAHCVHSRWRPAHQLHATSALCALEMACLDLKARQRNVPLSDILHTGTLESVETDITVPALSVSELASFWTHFGAHGFSVYKVKVTGASFSEDLDRCLAAHAHVPPGGALVLDGNQGFDVSKSLALVSALLARGVGVRFFEQPLPREDFVGLQKLFERSPVPVCLDESIRTVPDLVKHLGMSTKFLVNLKIMKSGIQESLALGLVAKAHGLGLMIGGMMETDLAMSCSLQLCSSLGGVDVCDLDTPFYLKSLACENSPWSEGNANLRVPKGPGIGVTPQGVDATGKRTGSPASLSLS